MAERRDDAVEAVEPQAHDGELLVPLDGVAQQPDDELAVRQPRQAVVMRLMEDAPLAIGDRLLHRVEAAGELAELVGGADVDRLVVDAFAHAPRGFGEVVHGPRHGLREPERARDREQQREARDREQEVAHAPVRRRRHRLRRAASRRRRRRCLRRTAASATRARRRRCPVRCASVRAGSRPAIALACTLVGQRRAQARGVDAARRIRTRRRGP